MPVLYQTATVCLYVSLKYSYVHSEIIYDYLLLHIVIITEISFLNLISSTISLLHVFLHLLLFYFICNILT